MEITFEVLEDGIEMIVTNAHVQILVFLENYLTDNRIQYVRSDDDDLIERPPKTTFSITDTTSIQILLRQLNLAIQGQQVFLRRDSRPNDQSYRCIRITNDVTKERCENIFAQDDFTAFVKCSILAAEYQWIGGYSDRGEC